MLEQGMGIVEKAHWKGLTSRLEPVESVSHALGGLSKRCKELESSSSLPFTRCLLPAAVRRDFANFWSRNP